MAKTKLDPKDDDVPAEMHEVNRVVRMPSGTLLFGLDVNLLKCNAEDRAFLFAVIDLLDDYDKVLIERERERAAAAQTERA